jgi:UDP-N-acetylmuramate--alanine ligase
MHLSSPIAPLPIDIGPIHFTGIGGIGMSGIAEILHHLGYQVQGSDMAENPNVQRLQALGIKVTKEQNENSLGGAAVVVRSSAIKDTNPEVQNARKRGIPVILRAEMLAEIMRLKFSIAIAGTHGKTTTTSLVACIFSAAKLDPTVINGGIINAYGTNAYLGKGQWLIAEADESDGTFLKLPATIGVITNIDPEHMEHYGTFDNLIHCFKNFILNLPFYGFSLLCKDHPVVATLATTILDRKIITYGIESEDCDIKAVNLRSKNGRSTYDVIISKRLPYGGKTLKDVVLATPGIHNILNSLAAIGIALELGIDETTIKNALAGFQGVQRRFTYTGVTNGITIIDDYGHHPKEISVTLKTARALQTEHHGNVIAVVQPHRYSRLSHLFEEFCQCCMDADSIIVAPVYSAGESPIEGIDHHHLAEGMRKHLKKPVYICDSEEQLPDLIKKIARSGDMVVCLGAGSITKWAADLPNKIAA